MAKKLISIEIGNTTTKVVEMDYQVRKPKVYKCAEFPTPTGAIRDGYIVPEQLEPLRDSIKKGLKTNKIHTKKVIFTLSSGKIITREILLPGVKEHQINAVIQSNITEYFPIELNDYKIAHIKINTFKEGENAGKHKVLVIAAENKLIKGYEELADLLGLNIIDIDYSGNSVFQATHNSAGAGAVFVLKIEEENALITVIKQGNMVMQRAVSYNLGRSDDDEPISMEDAAHTLVGTVMRVMDFYTSNDEGSNVERLYLIGEGSKNQQVIDIISEQTELNTMPLDTVRGVSIGKKVATVGLNVYATAIGAGISSVGFDSEKEKERHETNYVAASILMVMLVAVVAVALLSFSLIPYNTALIEQNSLKAKQQQLEPARSVYEQYNAMLNLIAKVRYGQALTHNSNDAILDFLSELEQKLPADVEVSDFSSSDTQCIISMTVDDKETAAGVINTLREFESISSVTVTSISENTVDNEAEDELSSASKNVTFTLTAQYYVQSLTEPTTTVSDTTVE